MNPQDAFPPSNLPPESQEWRRAIEDKAYELTNSVVGNGESVQGLNRTSASSLANLSEQLQLLRTQVQRVNDLYNALPIPTQRTDQTSNFGLSSSSWNTVASVTFTSQGRGKLLISAIAQGQLVSGSTSTNMEASVRLVSSGTASPVTPGLAATPDGVWVNNFVSSWNFEATDLYAGSEVTVQFQIDPVDPASWGSGTGSFAVLSCRATFVPG